MVLGLGGIAVVAVILAVIGVFAIRSKSKSAPVETTTAESVSAMPSKATGNGQRPESVEPAGQSSSGRYVPHVAEKNLLALMERVRKERGEEGFFEITERQVYEIMGKPTSRAASITVNRNGQTLTTYQARWVHREPNRELHTHISFTNGRFAGGFIGAEFTPGRNDPNQPPGTLPPAGFDRPLSEVLLGTWDTEIAVAYQPNPRKVHLLRLEFTQEGSCSATEYGIRGDSLTTTKGTWRVERTEANNLWIELKLRIPVTTEGLAMNQSLLLTFRNKSEWETRGLLRDATCPFRRR